MKKILIIIIGLLIGLFVWNKSEGLTNFNLSSWFQNEDKVNNSVIGGVGSPSTDLTFKTINGESILGYGNLNISSDLIIDVDELPKGIWKGTIVPNTGYVEKVYLNTSLSVEEVENLIDKLDYIIDEELGIVGVGLLSDINNDEIIMILNSETSKSIVDGNLNYLWTNFTDGTTSIGWQTFDNPIQINSEVVNEANGLSVGTQNELLSSLFSTTPFVMEKPDIDDKSIYRVSGSLDYKGIQILNGEKIELSNENFIINFVNELPEIGVDFFDMETPKFTFYYNTSDMMLYVYAGPIGSIITGKSEGIWMDATTVDNMPTSVIYNDSEIGNEEGRVYILITGNLSYFIYDESWVELVESRNINKYLPKEKHLYCHSINIVNNDSYEFNIWFDHITEKQSLSNLIDGGGGFADLFNGLVGNQNYLHFNANGYYIDLETQEKIGVIGIDILNNFSVGATLSNGESVSLDWRLNGFIVRQIF